MVSFNTEKDVKRSVKGLLIKYGWLHWMPAANGMGRTGVSDFCALKAGVFLGIETKYGSNKPTKNQIKYLNDVIAQGGFGFIVNEHLTEALEVWLYNFDKSVEYVSRKQAPPDEAGASMIDAMHAMTGLLNLSAGEVGR